MQSLKRVLGSLKSYWLIVSGAGVSLLLLTVANAVTPQLFRWAIDWGIARLDVSVVNQAFGQTIAQMLGNLFSLVGIVVAMVLIDLRLGLVSNLVVPVMIFTTGLFTRWARGRFRITRQTIGELSTKLEENIGSVREAQAFNRSQLNIEEFNTLNAANRDANVQARLLRSLLLFCPQSIF